MGQCGKYFTAGQTADDKIFMRFAFWIPKPTLRIRNIYCFSTVTIVTRKHLSVTFTNIFILSYEVCTAETSSRFLTGDGTVGAGNNDHSHLDRSHTDQQTGLCSMQRIVRTDFLTTICEIFSINPKMKMSHINESGMNEYL
jgi:hypothetical protein